MFFWGLWVPWGIRDDGACRPFHSYPKGYSRHRHERGGGGLQVGLSEAVPDGGGGWGFGEGGLGLQGIWDEVEQFGYELEGEFFGGVLGSLVGGEAGAAWGAGGADVDVEGPEFVAVDDGEVDIFAEGGDPLGEAGAFFVGDPGGAEGPPRAPSHSASRTP